MSTSACPYHRCLQYKSTHTFIRHPCTLSCFVEQFLRGGVVLRPPGPAWQTAGNFYRCPDRSWQLLRIELPFHPAAAESERNQGRGAATAGASGGPESCSARRDGCPACRTAHAGPPIAGFKIVSSISKSGA
eukprot:761706-Hanusia_phi.AAC.1